MGDLIGAFIECARVFAVETIKQMVEDVKAFFRGSET